MKVLIVDDDRDICEALTAFLEELGIEVKCCEGLKDSIEWLKHNKPEVIILDQYMKDGKGTELIPFIRQAYDAEIRIVVMTARPGVAEFIKSQGTDFFIQKPFGIDILENIIFKNSY
jgi:DNA-binding response OmpR family regulator